MGYEWVGTRISGPCVIHSVRSVPSLRCIQVTKAFCSHFWRRDALRLLVQTTCPGWDICLPTYTPYPMATILFGDDRTRRCSINYHAHSLSYVDSLFALHKYNRTVSGVLWPMADRRMITGRLGSGSSTRLQVASPRYWSHLTRLPFMGAASRPCPSDGTACSPGTD